MQWHMIDEPFCRNQRWAEYRRVLVSGGEQQAPQGCWGCDWPGTEKKIGRSAWVCCRRVDCRPSRAESWAAWLKLRDQCWSSVADQERARDYALAHVAPASPHSATRSLSAVGEREMIMRRSIRKRDKKKDRERINGMQDWIINTEVGRETHNYQQSIYRLLIWLLIQTSMLMFNQIIWDWTDNVNGDLLDIWSTMTTLTRMLPEIKPTMSKLVQMSFRDWVNKLDFDPKLSESKTTMLTQRVSKYWCWPKLCRDIETRQDWDWTNHHPKMSLSLLIWFRDQSCGNNPMLTRMMLSDQVLTQTLLEMWSARQFVVWVLSFDEANDTDINPNVVMILEWAHWFWPKLHLKTGPLTNDINPNCPDQGNTICWSNHHPVASLLLLTLPWSRDCINDDDDVDQTLSGDHDNVINVDQVKNARVERKTVRDLDNNVDVDPNGYRAKTLTQKISRDLVTSVNTEYIIIQSFGILMLSLDEENNVVDPTFILRLGEQCHLKLRSTVMMGQIIQRLDTFCQFDLWTEVSLTLLSQSLP